MEEVNGFFFSAAHGSRVNLLLLLSVKNQLGDVIFGFDFGSEFWSKMVY